jgi:putative endonuclease
VNKTAAGREGERRAAAALEAAGMRILARNFRSGQGEIDLVALDGETLVFVEVKAWNSCGIGELRLGLGEKKRRRIIETAKYFLYEHREYNCMTIRFDVIFIGSGTFSHIPSAFMEQS